MHVFFVCFMWWTDIIHGVVNRARSSSHTEDVGEGQVHPRGYAQVNSSSGIACGDVDEPSMHLNHNGHLSSSLPLSPSAASDGRVVDDLEMASFALEFTDEPGSPPPPPIHSNHNDIHRAHIELDESHQMDEDELAAMDAL
jgi:hypothetical protein